jgi:hypothetical protein
MQALSSNPERKGKEREGKGRERRKGRKEENLQLSSKLVLEWHCISARQNEQNSSPEEDKPNLKIS